MFTYVALKESMCREGNYYLLSFCTQAGVLEVLFPFILPATCVLSNFTLSTTCKKVISSPH